MNIAYYSHYFTPEIGAPSARIYDLSQQWLGEGHKVEVVTCYPNHPRGELYPGYKLDRYMHEMLDGIDVHRNWTYIAANKGFVKRVIGHISLWPSARLFSDKWLSQLDVTIGTSPTFFAAMGAIGAARRRNIPFVMEVRDLWPALFVELGVIRNRQIIWLLEKWEMWMYGQATKIVTVTESFRQNLIKRGVPAKKVHNIPNGANVKFWKPISSPNDLRQQLNLEDAFIVLYIGAHGISQGLSAILESAKRLLDQQKIQFLFVGAGAEKEMLMQKAQNYGLENVRFHEPVSKDEVKRFYALADICLVPLRNIPLFDTFIPSKMFEILAMQRPIIGSLRGEAADILQRSGGGLIVPPENGQAIANAISQLYHHPEQAKVMGQKGRQFVVEHYSRQGLAKRYIKILQEAIGEYQKK